MERQGGGDIRGRQPRHHRSGSHSDGLESLYSNLRTGCPVKDGQRLNAGDLIGYVGETAVAECGDGAHLHFEVRKDGRSVDPAEYVTVTE